MLLNSLAYLYPDAYLFMERNKLLCYVFTYQQRRRIAYMGESRFYRCHYYIVIKCFHDLWGGSDFQPRQ